MTRFFVSLKGFSLEYRVAAARVQASLRHQSDLLFPRAQCDAAVRHELFERAADRTDRLLARQAATPAIKK